jgi:ABC-type antimicrobial peptide transport system permease subunit
VRFGTDEKYAEVVGVTPDGKYRTLGEKARPYIYRPVEQQPDADLILLARVAIDARDATAAPAAIATLRQSVREFERQVPAMQFESLEDRISVSLLLPRVAASLFGFLGLLGLALASIGLYGVIAYTTSQRTHEIGIRMALGAKSREILQLVLRQGLILGAAGVAIGLAAAFAITRLLTVMLYGISATDSITFLGISLLLLLISLVASYIPARRATRVDPLVALRYE